MATKVITTPFPHTFNGEDFDYWSSRFEVWLKVFDLWKIVDEGFDDPEDETGLSGEPKKALEANRKKDIDACNQINLAIEKAVYEKISKAKNAKEAWQILNKTYKGDDKVKKVRLQSLISEFEKLQMKEDESIDEFFAKVTSVVNQMATNGEALDDQRVVEKILCYMPQKYFSLVTVLEELDKVFTLEDLQGTFKAYEAKINLLNPQPRQPDQALKSEVSSSGGRGSYNNRGRGENFRGRGGNSRGRGRNFSGNNYSSNNQHESNQNSGNNNNGNNHHGGNRNQNFNSQQRGRGRGFQRGRGRGYFECHFCHKPGHVISDC
ncbi:hypothetical protein EZV62_028214 [Acer yangbiense]|uniref:CCHC-type domain-containing protein n=1 Tax=Acer yangbiense TaxID=1000413 RepID=A0A5C7GQ04_9ROSI|nr:hypothetical protein EZV62_028214 [Acer yangbiense]